MENFIFESFDFISGLIAGGIGGAFLTLSITKSMRASEGGRVVDQSRATAGGDIVGGDKQR